MALLFTLGILLLALAAALLLRALSISRVRVASQVRQVESYGFNAGEVVTVAAPTRMSLTTRLTVFAERVGRACAGSGWRTPVPTVKLRGAGLYKLSADAFHGYRVIVTVGLIAMIVFDSALGGAISPMSVVLTVSIGALAWLAPALLVGTRAQRRMDRVDRDLPELIDLLIATIEAGLGFAGSLQLVSNRFDGPLGQELRLTLREQGMGLSTDRALNNLQERCDTPSVRAFVRAVSQGESLGVSIGSMMRNLAAETRKRRRQNANEQVQKAPVKMLFPLVFMIFPALLIVLLYPAIYQVSQQIGG